VILQELDGLNSQINDEEDFHFDIEDEGYEWLIGYEPEDGDTLSTCSTLGQFDEDY